MHDRYFYLADILSVLYALRYPRRWFVPVLVVSASFVSYFPFLASEQPVDLRIAASMMIAAFGIVLWDLLRALNAAKAADRANAREGERKPEEYAV
jgi:predicted signal transduction protein with EAL and GGDEF domain